MSEQKIPDIEQTVDPKDFRVYSVSLISSVGISREITQLVQEIQVRQDMYLGFISGEILVTDATDIHTLSALSGNEYIRLHLVEPGQQTAINKTFRIYKVSNRTPMPNANGQRYIIHFVSDEMFRSSLIKVTKAFKDTSISNIALEIMRDYLKIPEPNIFVEPTNEQVSIVIPNWSPLNCLNWLASRAYNTDNRVCYMFFENLDGFNFRSLKSLYDAPNPIKVPFTFEVKVGAKNIELDKYTIESMEAKKDFDILSLSGSGGIGMRLEMINPFERSYVPVEYNMTNIPTLHGNSVLSNVDNLYEKTRSHNLVYLNDGGAENWIMRVMSLALLNNNLVEIVVPGNIRIQAGKKVNIRVPYTLTPSNGDMWDKRKSGRYLVLAVNHKFDFTTNKFESIVLLGRDSLPEALPKPDASLTEKVNKLNQRVNRA